MEANMNVGLVGSEEKLQKCQVGRKKGGGDLGFVEFVD